LRTSQSNLPEVRGAPIQNSSSFRLASIDVLRGIAALSVALYHIWGHDGTYPWPSIGVVEQSADPHLLSYLTSPFRWGYLGVSFFLVLSGFCIHIQAARKRQETGGYGLQLREFFLRRIWRLYPAYAVAVIGTTILILLASLWFPGMHVEGYRGQIGFWDVLAHLTMLHGYFESTFYSIASVFWSLALEFQLYLLYPIFLLLFRKVGTVRAVLLLTLVSLVWRYFAMAAGYGLISVSEHGPYVLMGCVFARMPEWLFGAWLAEKYVAWRSTERAQPMRVGLIALFALIAFFVSILSTLSRNMWVVTDPLFGVAFTLVVAAAVFHKPGTTREPSVIFRFFAWLGVVSYTLYLFHLQFSWLVAPVIAKIPGVWVPFVARLVWLGLTIVVVRWLFILVEKPFLRNPKRGEKYFGLYSALRRIFGFAAKA
jgi:peptidoglycan/LPS O-acetylase OafA/YrhL